MATQMLSGREVIEHLRKIMPIPHGVSSIRLKASARGSAVCECEYAPYRHGGLECSDETAGGIIKGDESWSASNTMRDYSGHKAIHSILTSDTQALTQVSVRSESTSDANREGEV